MTKEVLELVDGKVRVKEKKRSKYGNKIVKYAGMTFHSHAELKRWLDLRIEERAGTIYGLHRQTDWPLVVNGQLITTYRDDFNYVQTDSGERVVEDVKGGKAKTSAKQIFDIKSRLMLACHGINILITGKGVK